MKIRILKHAKVLAVLAVFLMAAFVCPDARATEGGGGAYANGAQGFLAGALPPPGFYFIEYLQHYSTNSLMDDNGDKIPIPFKLNVSAAVQRFLWQSEIPVLGGHFGAYMVIPLVHASADTGLGSGSKSGLGDISVAPLIAWHFNKNFHMATGVEMVMPTGNYNKNELVNIGRNYWTFEPIVTMTYLFDSGVETSIKLMYDFNTKNNATHYRSGQEFHFDYAAGYHYGPWTAGAVGYYYQQVTGDGGTAPAGNIGRVIAAGPGIRYDAKNGVSIEARWNEEFAAKNKTEGSKLWVNVFAKF